MAIHYKDLSFKDKLKFKFWSPHTAMGAVLDYFEDHNMLEVKTKDDKGDVIDIDTGIWSVYGDGGIRINWRGRFWGSYHQDVMEDILKNQKGNMVVVPYGDFRKHDDRLDDKHTLTIPRKDLEKVIEIRNKVIEAGVIKAHSMGLDQLAKDVDLQFDIINKLGIENHFLDRLHGLRDNFGFKDKK